MIIVISWMFKPTKLFDMNIQLITIIIVFLFVGVSLVAQFLG